MSIQPRILRNKNCKARWTLAWCFPLIVATLGPNGAVFAQTASTGAIRGAIVDPTGAGVPGVVVEAMSSATGTQRKSVSEANGIYTVGLLPPGAYQLRF